MNSVTVSSDMQTPALSQQFITCSQGKVPGRKRGRPPIRKLLFESCYVEPLTSIKVPKKRGRKPGFKLKPRMLMSPLASSPPNSTPEPEMGSLPHDAAIVPHSATPQVLTDHASGSSPGPPLGGTCPDNLPKKASRGHPIKMPEPPQQAPFDVEEKRLYSKLLPAETTTPDEFLRDPPAESKRFALAAADSAYSVIGAPYYPKRTFGFRSNSCPTPLPACRQASSPRCCPEGPRNGYSHLPEVGDTKRPSNKDPSSWGVEDVVWFIQVSDPQALGPHAETFRKHEIDGDALLLLKSEMMMKYLGLKLGPALKLCYHIDKLKQSRS